MGGCFESENVSLLDYCIFAQTPYHLVLRLAQLTISTIDLFTIDLLSSYHPCSCWLVLLSSHAGLLFIFPCCSVLLLIYNFRSHPHILPLSHLFLIMMLIMMGMCVEPDGAEWPVLILIVSRCLIFFFSLMI